MKPPKRRGTLGRFSKRTRTTTPTVYNTSSTITVLSHPIGDTNTESYTCQNQNQNQNNCTPPSSIKPPRPRTTPLERNTEQTPTLPPQKFPLYTHTHLIKHARAKAKEEERQNRGRDLLFSFAFSIISVLLCSIKRLSFKVKVVPFWTT